jgi:hypothetical protein
MADAPWYLAPLVSLPTLLIFVAIAAAIIIVIRFAWRVITGREK